ncbi:MAG: DHH family phosphoesterase, partial [Nanoarchaeota archaeon]|nr:DHH family phosphoesterase [Nanoarchaeota archaeon]
MENNTFEEIWEKLKGAKRVLRSLHYGPDGDSLGCCTAMKYVLQRDFNCDVKLVSKDNLDSTLGELKYAKEVEFGEGIDDQNLEEFDVVLAMDSGSKKQFVGRDREFDFPEGTMLIVLDHHASNNYFGNLNYVDDKRVSACSVLLDLFKDRSVKFDSELATRLLLGIYTDSGHFAHDNGGALKDAAFLIDNGADYLNDIVNKVKYNTPLRIKKYIGLLYNNFKTCDLNGLRIGYSSISLEDVKNLGLNLSEVRGGVNDLQEVGGFDIIFTLGEREESIKGSFRSRKGVNVSKLAELFGGGGHRAA